RDRKMKPLEGVLRQRGWLVVVLVVGLIPGCSPATPGSASTVGSAWFGVQLPPGLTPEALQVESTREAAPAVVPAGEERFTELEGQRLRSDLESIVAISVESRQTQEFGTGQLWGRVTGFPSGTKVIEWAAAQFSAAGLDAEIQRFEQDSGAALRLALSWEVRLLGSP